MSEPARRQWPPRPRTAGDNLITQALAAGAGPILAREAAATVRMSRDDVGTHTIPGTVTTAPKPLKVRRPGSVPVIWRIDQTITDPGLIGNCWQAVIASVTATPLREVPHFVHDDESGGPYFLDATQEWLASRGFRLTTVHCQAAVESRRIYLAVGRSVRGKSHVVLKRGRKLVHDPHPSRAGLSGAPWMTLVLETLAGAS